MTQFAKSVSPELFPRMQTERKTALILDGFDEVATHSTEEERMMQFARVMRIAERTTHLVITSRPSYFSNLTEINELISRLISRDFKVTQRPMKKLRRADVSREEARSSTSELVRRRRGSGEYRLFPENVSSVYYLKPLTKAEIIEYFSASSDIIKRKHKKSPEQVYEALSKVYDVTDLITRPLLLDMFAEILEEGQIRLDDPDLEIGPASLYQDYVNLHLDRDWKTRQFLTRDERLTFARAAAVAMLESGYGNLEASYESIERIVRSGMNGLATGRREKFTTDMPRVVNDVRVCSFINVTASNRIEFAHRSFMEYFAADVIVSKLKGRIPIAELQTELNYEILYFVGSFCLLRSDYRIDIRSHLQHVRVDHKYASRLRLALLYSERDSHGEEYKNFEFDTLKLRKRTFEQCSFEAVRLTRASLDDVVFGGCKFDDVQLDNQFNGTSFSGVSGRLEVGGIFRKCSFEDIDDFAIVGASPTLQFEEGHWKDVSISLEGSSLEFSRVHFQKVSLDVSRVPEVRLLGLRGNIGSINGLRGQTRQKPYLTNLQIQNCKFVDFLIAGLAVSRETFLTIETALQGGLYGYIYVEDNADNITRFVRKERGTGVIKYVGWTVVGRVLCASTRVAWNRREAMPPHIWWRTATPDDIAQWAEKHLGAAMDDASLPAPGA